MSSAAEILAVEQTSRAYVYGDDVHVVVSQATQHFVVAIGQQGPEGVQGPIGPAGGSAMSVMAGSALGGHRMVRLDATEKAVYASADTLSHLVNVLGMTLNAAAANDAVDVLRSGEIVEPTWTWIIGLPVYLGTNGLLTQTPPVAPSFQLIVGFPITATKLFLSFREPIVLN